MPEPIFRLRHVDVARGQATVLHDISISLDSGEHLVILGPNGCGKSTLLKTLTCELYPIAKPETEVSIFGQSRWDLADLKRRLGVVSADLPGRPMFQTTGFDALLTGFFSSSTLWPNLSVTGEMRDRAEEVLRLVDPEHGLRGQGLRDKLVGEMSAGEQRRIMIGRALVGVDADSLRGGVEVQHPHMLLLDEPSNALDLAAQRELRTLLRRLAGQGITIILITHHTADIIPEIDRVLLMQSGRIVADGPKRDLLTALRLSDLFQTEVQISERDGFFTAW